MDNYTPIDLEKIEAQRKTVPKSKSFNLWLLILADIAAAVLAFMLFILIKLKLNSG